MQFDGAIEIPVRGNAWKFISGFLVAWWRGCDYVVVNVSNIQVRVSDNASGSES